MDMEQHQEDLQLQITAVQDENAELNEVVTLKDQMAGAGDDDEKQALL